ncbi:hypothetical protein [Agromyces aerolatus]|uniref:hypothetical protein n=1 Tax=Agromyces sp. LY-1074 TaxID=3074080 RepID=UPI0028655430|nr:MULTISPECIES: hypothetical protein [unclassified Agromyces]MDR5698473.1 hypothetical protein [Agromyces sp. LY-1074]MDR5704767.1 hypothetical protein [Agromyces sp. LY-1358]
MASSSLRRAALAGAALASVFLLAACAPGTSPAESYQGEPEVEHIVAEDEEGAAEEDTHAVEGETSAVWLQQGGQLAITTWGSSGCPIVGTDIKVIEPRGEGNTVEIVTKEYPEDQICTMDFVPFTTVFWTPLDVTTTEPLTVLIEGEEIEVPVK